MRSALTRAMCRLLIAMMTWLPIHAAQAGMISTDRAVGSISQLDRAAVLGLIERSEVSSQLQALGIDLSNAKARIAALSDDEVRSLAGKLHSLPAGADGAGFLLTVVVLGMLYLIWFR